MAGLLLQPGRLALEDRRSLIGRVDARPAARLCLHGATLAPARCEELDLPNAAVLWPTGESRGNGSFRPCDAREALRRRCLVPRSPSRRTRATVAATCAPSSRSRASGARGS